MKMKVWASIILLFGSILWGCGTSQQRKEERMAQQLLEKEKAVQDSIFKAFRDSIQEKTRLEKVEREAQEAAERAKRLAHLNRPWKLNYFVDDFGDKTNEKYIETKTEGTFSNSATSNSYLYAEVIVTKVRAGIFLHEYNQNRPMAKFIGGGSIALKNSKNETLSLPIVDSWNNSGGQRIGGTIYTSLRRFLMDSEGLVQIVIRDKYSSVYRFSIDMQGFKEEFDQL